MHLRSAHPSQDRQAPRDRDCAAVGVRRGRERRGGFVIVLKGWKGSRGRWSGKETEGDRVSSVLQAARSRERVLLVPVRANGTGNSPGRRVRGTWTSTRAREMPIKGAIYAHSMVNSA